MATVRKELEISGEPIDASDHLTVSEWLAETLVRWRIVARVMGLTLVAAVLAVLVIPPVYRTQVSFVANSSSGSRLPAGLAAAAVGPLAGLATQLGVSSGADPSESPNFYMQLIQSRELLTRLLQSKFRDPRGATARDSARLIDILRFRGSDPQRKLEKGIKKISKAITGGYDINTNLVWVEVDTQWPDLSAAIANRTIDLVTNFNKEQRVSRVRSKRVFLEGRVANAKADLNAAEDHLRQFNEQNRSWRSAPSLVFDEQHLQREVDGASELYLQLQRQYESTLLDEVNDAARISVVDTAIAPRKPEWPDYPTLLLSALATGLFLGLIMAGTAAVLADWRARNPRSSTHLSSTFRAVRRDIRNVFKRTRARRVNG
ncbi:MAG: GNVR domain-containing protein [Gemmatimonadaceae bacterium]